MSVYTQPQDFVAALQSDAVAALDPGKKRVGLALGHVSLQMALPAAVLPREKFAKDMPKVRVWLRERQVGGLIIGWPLNMDDSVGPAAQGARDFALRLQQTLALPVLLLDERLSSFEAENRLIAGGVKSIVRAQTIDAHAAACILETFFAHLRRMPCLER